MSSPVPTRVARLPLRVEASPRPRVSALGLEDDLLQRPHLSEEDRLYVRALRQERELLRLRIRVINEAIEANQELERGILGVGWSAEDLDPGT